MIANYYFWKWADNDLQGKPGDVHATLLRGGMHPALQPFDSRPLLKLLSKTAAKGRRRGEQWDWAVTPEGAKNWATFVFLTCPEIEKYDGANWKLLEHFLALDLGGFDESRGRPIDFLLPKLNGFELGQFPNEEYADVCAEELPSLLGKIQRSEPDATAKLTDRHNHFVQCCAFERRFTVQWRENHDLLDLRKFDQWNAEYPPDVETRKGRRIRRKFIPAGLGNALWTGGEWRYFEAVENEYELICLSDVLRIFKAFIEGKGRPSGYGWRNINAEFSN